MMRSNKRSSRDNGHQKQSTLDDRDDTNRPSQWKLLYGKKAHDTKPCTDVEESSVHVDESLNDWIESVQERADAKASVEGLTYEEIYGNDGKSPTDNDVADVISEMEKILSGGISSNDEKTPFESSIFYDDPDSDVNRYIDFDTEPFSLESITGSSQSWMDEVEPLRNKALINNDRGSFSSESIAQLFRKGRNEKILRICYSCLSSHSQKEKKRLRWIEKLVAKKKRGKDLGQAFLLWRHNVRMRKVKEVMLVCKVGRATSRRFRYAFSSWKKMSQERRELKNRLIDKIRQRKLRRTFSLWSKRSNKAKFALERSMQRHSWRAKSRVLSSWHRFVRLQKSRREESTERLERIKLAQNIKNADQHHELRRLRMCFTVWLAVVERDDPIKISHEETEQKDDHIRTDEPNCMPDHDCSNENDGVTEANSPGSTYSKSSVPPRRKIKQSESVATKLFATPPKVDHDDKENHQPNREENTLLSPWTNRKQAKPLRTPPTPKLILQMNERQKERERRRDMLRSRYEQAAIEKKKRIEEERLRKEEEEFRLQQEEVQRKVEEENRKKMDIARRKNACRLAVLHYKMTLQKRMFLQWKRVFDMISFHNRKAYTAWSDATFEKCWQRWRFFTADEQRKRAFRMQKRKELADDFNERRLLAKSFATWEEECKYNKSLIHESQERNSARKRKTMFSKWRNSCSLAKEDRHSKGNQAQKYGHRLLLRCAIRCWKSGVTICQQEREMERLINAKWEEVNKWLGE